MGFTDLPGDARGEPSGEPFGVEVAGVFFQGDGTGDVFTDEPNSGVTDGVPVVVVNDGVGGFVDAAVGELVSGGEVTEVAEVG